MEMIDVINLISIGIVFYGTIILFSILISNILVKKKIRSQCTQLSREEINVKAKSETYYNLHHGILLNRPISFILKHIVFSYIGIVVLCIGAYSSLQRIIRLLPDFNIYITSAFVNALVFSGCIFWIILIIVYIVKRRGLTTGST